jgi:hypothetical protein
VAIFVATRVHGGRKSGIKGNDLEFEDAGKKYLVATPKIRTNVGALRIRELLARGLVQPHGA